MDLNLKYQNQYLIKPDGEGGRADTKLAVELSDDDINNLLKQGYYLINNDDFNRLVGNADKAYSIDADGHLYPTPAYVPPLDELKQAKLTEVDQYISNKITGGFESDGVTYDSDVDTQLTMQGIALNADTPLFAQKYPDGCPVRGYDKDSDVKTIHYLNGKQVMQWMADLSMHIGACKQEGWALQDKISKAKTAQALDKIVVPH